jgi:PDDEXK-like domain of unknown function (DUF3799)
MFDGIQAHAGPVCLRDQPIDTYHADASAISSSVLKLILRSPAHCAAYLRDGTPETPRMLNGRALHAALLEPGVFARAFAVLPKVDRRTKAGKAQWSAFEQEHADKQLIRAEDCDYIGRLQVGLSRHKRARQLAELDGEAELSLYWNDRTTGLRLKARPDRILRALPILVEVKSTADAQREAFAKRIVAYDYHLSLAMYLEGVREVLQRDLNPVFFVIEDRTFELCLYKPDAQMLRLGYQRFRTAVERYARCAETQRWPGYQPDARIEEISLPRWAIAPAERSAAEALFYQPPI